MKKNIFLFIVATAFCTKIFAQPTVTISSTNNACFGACNGTATGNPVGGLSPYTYIWSDSNAQTTQTATGLCAGNYTLMVTDASAYTATATVAITQPSPISVFVSSTAAQCNGLCNGVAIASATGGTPGYTYLWSPSSETTSAATGLCAGNHTVTITDANGCQQTATATVNQPPALSASFTLVQDTVNPLLWYANTAITGGVAPLSYLWDFGDGNTSTLQYPSHTYAAPGHYPICLTVADMNGCTATTCDSTYKVMVPGIIQYLTVTAPLITSIAADQPQTDIAIFPNPSNGKFSLQAGSLFTKYDLEIYNIMGEKVYSSHTPPLSITNRKFEIDLSKQSKGIYLLKIIFDKGVVKKKIIIQ